MLIAKHKDGDELVYCTYLAKICENGSEVDKCVIDHPDEDLPEVNCEDCDCTYCIPISNKRSTIDDYYADDMLCMNGQDGKQADNTAPISGTG